MFCACLAFSSYYNSSTKCSTVVEVPWLPEVNKGHVTPSGFPVGVRMHNGKLRNIRPSRAFLPEVPPWGAL